MTTLHIQLFGGMRVAHRGKQVSTVSLPHAAQVILAFIVLQPKRSYSRDVLLDLAWGDRPEEQARSCLNTALWRLRRSLEPEGIARGTYLVSSPEGEVGFNWDSDFWLDLSAFETAVKQLVAVPVAAMGPADARRLEEAVALYEGELLEGFYDEWALRARERLRSANLNALVRLLRYHGLHGSYEAALGFGEQVLRLDPLREEVHREMMGLYVSSGQRALAIRQYQMCHDVLAAELGIEPMTETQDIYRKLLNDGTGQSPARAGASLQGPRLDAALQQVALARQSLAAARDEMQQALAILEQLLCRSDSP